MEWRAELVDHEPWNWKPVEYSRPLYDESTGLVVVGTSSGSVVAVDRAQGKVEWRFPTNSRVDSSPVKAGGYFLVGDDNGILRALNEGGAEVWSYTARGEIDNAVTVSHKAAFFVDSSETLHAVNLEDGSYLWAYDRDLPDYFTVGSSARPTYHDGKVFTGFADGHIVALKASDGDILWGKNLSAGAEEFIDVDSAPLVAHGKLYVSSYAGGLYALDADSGKVLWRLKITGASKPVLHNGRLYLTTANRYVVAVDAETGKKLWQFRHGENTPTEPILVDDFLLYGGAISGVYLVDRVHGDMRLRFDSNSGFSAPVTVDQNSRSLFFFSNKGYLYAMRLLER